MGGLKIKNYIDYSQIHDILSIYTTFYDDILSKKCNVDVIYNEFEHVNMIGHSARVDFMDLDGYSFQEGRYPQKFERKYDLIIMQLDYDDFNMMDKSFYYEIDDSNIAHFVGDKILYNISKMMHNLNDNGYAVIKLPYTFVSKLDNSIIDQNIIDKIVYLPCEDCVFSNEFAKIKMAYVIVKNNKSDFNIEFIDKLTKERCLVKNADIKTHKGVTNMHIYNRNNPMLEKIYRIKEDNAKQLDIISKESEFINKQIDELDFE